MDSVQSREVSAACFPVEERANDNENPIYRNIHCQVENGGWFIATFRAQPDFRTVVDILRTSAAKSPNADCTGERVIGPDGSAVPYIYLTYRQFLHKLVSKFSQRLPLAKADDQLRDKPRTSAAEISFTC
jgi:long-chain acyl-CoA synthetase